MNIHQRNPEGTSWSESFLFVIPNQKSDKSRPQIHQPFAVDIQLNQHGHTFVLTDDNQLFFRTGVCWQHPYGTAWQQLTCHSPPLRTHEHLVTVRLGQRSIWVLANTGNCWFRADLNAAGLPAFPYRPWSAMAGRLKCISVSATEQVFAVDLQSNRLIYRSNITPSTPGGEFWVSFDLPILPSLSEEHQSCEVANRDGLLGSFDPSQNEAVQLAARILQPNKTARKCLSKVSPGQLLCSTIGKLFTARNQNSMSSFSKKFPQTDTFVDETGSIIQNNILPHFDRPPRLNFICATAMSDQEAIALEDLPLRWRISSLISEKTDFIPYFTLRESLVPPNWYQQIQSALSSRNHPIGMDPYSNCGTDNSAPLIVSFTVDVLRAVSTDPTRNQPATWFRGECITVNRTSEKSITEFSLVDSASRSQHSIRNDNQPPDKLTCQDISWAGHIGTLSTLIPRIQMDIVSGSLPIDELGCSDPADSQKKQSLDNQKFASPRPYVVAVFRKMSGLIKNDDVTNEQPSYSHYPVIPVWIMHFSSPSDASQWLGETQTSAGALPASGKIWMVSEQSEVFCAAGTSVETIFWKRVGGHFSRIDSLSVTTGQVTWAVGYNGTPWAHREDWDSPSSCNTTDFLSCLHRFSNSRFPFDTPHIQIDNRQFGVYESKAQRMHSGCISSDVVWSRDAQCQHPCTPLDIHLPPHSGRVRWLNDWQVEFSQQSSLIPHSVPLWKNYTHIGDSNSHRGNLDPTIPPSSQTIPSDVTEKSQSGNIFHGTLESCTYPEAIPHDRRGWQPLTQFSYCGKETVSGLKRRRWVRSYSVCTEGPWQEIGPLKLKCLTLSHGQSSDGSIDLWTITDSCDLVYRRGVTVTNPAGLAWINYPLSRPLTCVATSPKGECMWVICADFGLIWSLQNQPSTPLREALKDAQWCCLGFSPLGCPWSLLASSAADCLWAVDVEGQVWVHSTDANEEKREGDTTACWLNVRSPKVSDISCSPDGQVWAVFPATNTLAVRIGISPSCPSGTGWMCAFEGITSSICIKGALSHME